MVSHFFFFLNVKMHMEYKHSEGMSQEVILGNLRWAQVHSIMCVCVCERYSVALKIWAEGMFARRKFIETKGGGK